MHTTSWKDERASYPSNADITLTVAKSEVMGLVDEVVYPIHAERIQAEV